MSDSASRRSGAKPDREGDEKETKAAERAGRAARDSKASKSGATGSQVAPRPAPRPGVGTRPRPVSEPKRDVPDDEVDAEDAADTPSAEVSEDLEMAKAEAADHLAHLQRLKAEFDNYRKRMLREQSDVVARASGKLIEALLPALDSFDYAVDHAPELDDDDDADEATRTFLSGVKAVRAQITGILDKEGLERIDPEPGSEFDPVEHEPVAHRPGDGSPEVSRVMRPGYRLKGRLLRPAMVEVTG